MADFGGRPLDVLVGEPFYSNNMLPWQRYDEIASPTIHDSFSLYFWYIRSALDRFLAPNAIISPNRACIKGVAVEFEHFHKCRSPLGQVAAFNT